MVKNNVFYGHGEKMLSNELNNDVFILFFSKRKGISYSKSSSGAK